MNDRRLDKIQGLRALAALLVVVAHSILSLVEKGGLDPVYQNYGSSSGALGVRVFFAISGFVMVYTTSKVFFTRDAPRRFALKRLLRIIPLYYLTTLVYSTKLALQGQLPDTTSLLSSLFFIPHVNASGLLQPVYGLGWTLNYEMFFYLLFSLALFLRFSIGMAVLGISFLSLVIIGVYLPPLAGTGFWIDWLTFVCNPIIGYFVIGLAIGCVRARTRLTLPSWPAPTTLVVCLVMCLVGIIGSTSEGTSGLAMMITAAVCVIFAGLASSPPDARVDTFHLRMIRSLGDASYSVYLTHSFLVGPAARGWQFMPGAPNQTWPLFLVAMLVGCSLLGLLTYHLVEKPMIDWLRRTSGLRTSANELRPILEVR